MFSHSNTGFCPVVVVGAAEFQFQLTRKSKNKNSFIIISDKSELKQSTDTVN